MASFSGDVKLTPTQKVRWLAACFWEGVSGYGRVRSPVFWQAQTFRADAESPYRKMINAFLEAELPKIVPHRRVRVLDIGCGTGYLYQLMTSIGLELDYTGLDVEKRPAFDRNVPGGELVLEKIEDFRPTARYDLVVSNTCLEHVENDRLAAQKALTFGPTQVHVVPTFWSLPLYLWHGYRQYSPHTLNALFGNSGRAYRLGGVFSFFLYFFLITVPQRLRVPSLFQKRTWYPTLCSVANRLDGWLPWMSAMYVVVIEDTDRQTAGL